MTNPVPAKKAIVLFGHGSRDPLWRGPIEAVAARLAQRHPLVPVRCAYLEFDTPSLREAVGAIAAEGVESVSIVPMFLGTGTHARRDLPALLQELRFEHPAIHFELQRPIGDDPRVLDLLATIAFE